MGSDSDESERRAKKGKVCASGHSAGIINAKEFGSKQKKLDAEKRKFSSDADAMGGNTETVYRDKRGKKLDMLSEFMRQQTNDESKKTKLEQAQFEWGQGAAQKKERELNSKEMEILASEPFARTAEDPRLEKMRKSTLRDGDPMAKYFESKREKEGTTLNDEDEDTGANTPAGSRKQSKPIYSGPMPAPNRFRIKPGYRWDGVDRGNKYEHKLLTFISDKASIREDEYKWSVSDL